MASLLKRSGRYYIQFYDSNRSPKQKQRALRCKRKRPAQQIRRKLEEGYALGAYDPRRAERRCGPVGLPRRGTSHLRARPSELPVGECDNCQIQHWELAIGYPLIHPELNHIRNRFDAP